MKIIIWKAGCTYNATNWMHCADSSCGPWQSRHGSTAALLWRNFLRSVTSSVGLWFACWLLFSEKLRDYFPLSVLAGAADSVAIITLCNTYVTFPHIIASHRLIWFNFNVAATHFSPSTSTTTSSSSRLLLHQRCGVAVSHGSWSLCWGRPWCYWLLELLLLHYLCMWPHCKKSPPQ